jgi:hypothetical protein
MTRHAMESEHDRCRVVAVTTMSATRWLVSLDCKAAPDKRYGWTFFRHGETLYLTPVGTFMPR